MHVQNVSEANAQSITAFATSIDTNKKTKETPLLQIPQSLQGTAANVKHQLNERLMPCLDECHMCTVCITILISIGSIGVGVMQFCSIC